MAQLPPKIPISSSSSPNWPPFIHQRMPSLAAPDFLHSTSNNIIQPPHQQELQQAIPFSGAHRRSMSDSFVFLESPTVVDECRNLSSIMMFNNISMHGESGNGFDKLDDEQLMSMLSNDHDIMMSMPVTQILSSNSNPSTPYDQKSNDEDQKPTAADQNPRQPLKTEPEEVDSSCQPDSQTQAPPTNTTTTSNGDPFNDPKRVKRIIANRQSAQRSRVRKLRYISELERSVTTLQSEVSALSPRVAFLDHQRLMLSVDNSAIKQRIAALAQDRIFKDAHQEALKKEIERLRQVYSQQNLTKMGNQNNVQQQPPSSPQ